VSRCELAELNFFGFKVQPVLTAQVDVLDEGAGTIIRVTDAHIGGSEVAEAASDTFMGACSGCIARGAAAMPRRGAAARAALT
jgi:hypothetical protein